MTWYWAWCHGVQWPHRSDATLHTMALMLRNSESLVTVLGWHWLSSSPRLQHRCLIRGDHYPSSGFARLQECDPQKETRDFFLVTGLKRQQRDHCHSRAGEQFFQYLPEFNTIWLLTLNQITKVTGSPYDKLQINIILIPYCLTDINQTNHCWFNLLRNLCTDYRYEGHGTGGLYLSLGLS